MHWFWLLVCIIRDRVSYQSTVMRFSIIGLDLFCFFLNRRMIWLLLFSPLDTHVVEFLEFFLFRVDFGVQSQSKDLDKRFSTSLGELVCCLGELTTNMVSEVQICLVCNDLFFTCVFVFNLDNDLACFRLEYTIIKQELRLDLLAIFRDCNFLLLLGCDHWERVNYYGLRPSFDCYSDCLGFGGEIFDGLD